MHYRNTQLIHTIVLFFFSSFFLSAVEPVKISRTTEQIEFDGLPFENAWNGKEMYPLIMYRPDFGADPSEKSEVMITYDEDFLWIGARLYVRDPSTIKSTSKKRDEQSRNSDAFAIILDTFNDKENAMAFGTMPSGLRFDFTVSNDANMPGGAQVGIPGGGTTNISWNTFWDVKTTRDEKGWYVEMRIPFSSLRFQSEDGIVKMGLIIQRAISSKNELDTYPRIDPKFGTMAALKPSLSTPIEFSDIRPRKPVYVSPYIIGGYALTNELNNQETAYLKKDDPKFDVGLDLKYSLTSNLTMDVTLNTDFAQVEADNQQVNLTRYSLYFPEKRLFFQERSSIFSYNLGGSSDMFYSRRIGIEEDNPVRIFGGAKLIGRAGKWDIGFLDMQTQEFDTIPANNFGVARLRRQVINQNSYIGGLITSKVGNNGSYDLAYGVDGIIRVFGQDYINLKLAQNLNSSAESEALSLKPTLIRANWERRSDKGFSYNMTYAYFGENFNPQIGFLKYLGAQGFEGELLYGWLPGADSRIFRSTAVLKVNRMTRIADGQIESFTLAPGYEIYGKNGYGILMSLTYNEEGVDENFDLSNDIQVLAGKYAFYGAEATFFTPQSKPYYTILTFAGGEYYDGNRFSFMLSPMLSISQSIQLSGTYQFSYVDFSRRNQQLKSHVANVRLLYMFNIKLSASFLVQYNNITDAFVGNFRLRYNPKEGNDFYLVVDENRNVGNNHLNPEPPSFYNRAVMVKYTHTFKL
jgi:hypothetical protein